MENLNVNLKSIFFDILRRAWLIILAFLIGTGGFYFLFEKRKVVNYTSSAKLFISATIDPSLVGSADAADLTSLIYSVSISNAAQLVNLLTIILPTDVCAEKVMAELDKIDGTADGVFTGATGTKYSPAVIGNMVKLAQVKDSVIMSVTATTACAEDSVSIVNATCGAMQDILDNVVGRGKVSPLQLAKNSLESNLPTIRKPLIVGLVAALAVVMLVVLLNIFDTRIHSKEEIVSNYHLTVLGEIPHFSPVTAAKSGKGYAYVRKKKE